VFLRASLQQELAYSANFFLRLMTASLNLVSGIAGLWALYSQVEIIHGWDMPSALALLGVYLLLGAIRDLFIGPSLDSLAGMDGELWTGRFDFTVLKPINKQFLVSLRQWRPFALLDIGLALSVIVYALILIGRTLSFFDISMFVLALTAGVLVFYAVLLFFSSLIFWNQGFMFTWLFNDIFQLARYPVGLYPGWLRLILTWIIPVAAMTTIPAEALRSSLSSGTILFTLTAALFLFLAASIVFRRGLRQYVSASS
jgi:ABC-2 type transport system permease protein